MSTEEGTAVSGTGRVDDARGSGVVVDVFEGWRDARDGGYGGNREGTFFREE